MTKRLVRPEMGLLLDRKPGIVPAPPKHPSGRPVINFTLGDPAKVDNKTFFKPAHIVNAAKDTPYHGEYFPPAGHPLLLSLLSQRLGTETERILVTDGGSEGINIIARTVGGRILLPSPCFPPYIERVEYEGKEPTFYRVDLRTGPDLDDMRRKITEDTVAILVINPNNPTGMVYSRDALEAIIEIAKAHGIMIIADEVYNKLCFDMIRPPLLKGLTKEVPILELGSFSKEYLMCGDRVGWLAFYNMTRELDELRRAAAKMCTTRLSANALGQLAAIAALRGSTRHLDTMIPELIKRAAIMQHGLEQIPGAEIIPPRAGFYLWFGLPKGRFDDDFAFARELGEHEAVYLLAGNGFTREQSAIENGTLWFRAVFLPPIEVIEEGVERIRRFVLANQYTQPTK